MSDKFVEIPKHHHWFWYMKSDSPWLELKNPKDGSCAPYGHVRSWIEENTNGKVFIQFGNSINEEKTAANVAKRDNNITVYDNRVLILFDEPTDYMAFKIMFPELCKV